MSRADKHLTGPNLANAAVTHLREIVATVLDTTVDEIPVDALFYDDLMADSLQKLEIVVQIERAFGVKLDDGEAAELRSVQDALGVLSAKGATAHG